MIQLLQIDLINILYDLISLFVFVLAGEFY